MSPEITFKINDDGSVAYKGDCSPKHMIYIMLCCVWHIQESQPPHGVADILDAIAGRLVAILDITNAIEDAIAAKPPEEKEEPVH